MKIYLSFCFLQAAAILFAGSTAGYAQSPEGVVRSYWEAMIQENYGAAWEVISERQKEILPKEQYVAFYERHTKDPLNKITHIEIDSVEPSRDAAVVRYTLTNATPQGNRYNKGSEHVVKENGRWSLILPERIIKIIAKKERTDEEKLTAVTQCTIATKTLNWRRGPEDDGIAVFPALRDAEGRVVRYEGVKLPIEVRVYAVKKGADGEDVEDTMVYSRSTYIDTWKYGSVAFFGGVKIPFEDMKTEPSHGELGVVYATVTLPDGRDVEAKDERARIKPESR